MENPLSESSVTLKLEEIRNRCAELIENPTELAELTLEDGQTDSGANDPYNSQRS